MEYSDLEPKLGPMALAVLAHLYERPMHPYEIAFTMRERGLDHSIKLNFGTLYHTVEQLLREGQVTALETGREGRRPERTVYRLTDIGREHFLHWLRELIRVPAKEYSRFEAGLAFIWHLGAGEAVGLLRERISAVDTELDFHDFLKATLTEKGVTALALIELDYWRAQRTSELEWLKKTVDEIESGRLAWSAELRRDKPTLEAKP